MSSSNGTSTHTPVTMRDVAKAAGVSISAVSLAMKNSPKVSPRRQQAILDIADKLGYRRDPRITELMAHLRTARSQRSHSQIAILIPELTRDELRQHQRFLDIISGVRQVADIAGFGTELFHLADPGMSSRRIRDILLTRGIKGIIVTPFPRGVGKLDFDFTGFSSATAGYSIVQPRLHRACPDYLQMMDELLAACDLYGYKRIGLVMTYSPGGVGHKLFTSSFLYHQSLKPKTDNIPILPRASISPASLRNWINKHKPDVIISDGAVYHQLLDLGLRIPKDIGFASIDISEAPTNAAGADHRHLIVGREAMKLLLTALNLNNTGIPSNPKVVLADSHQREGFSLIPQTPAAKRATAKLKTPQGLLPLNPHEILD